MKLTSGQRYQITFNQGPGYTVKTVVLDFMEELDTVYLFSARPRFGTQTLPKAWVQTITQAPPGTPIKI